LKEDFMPASRAFPHLLVGLFFAFVVAGCTVVGGIFKAGFWTGIFLVVVIVVVLTLLLTK